MLVMNSQHQTSYSLLLNGLYSTDANRPFAIWFQKKDGMDWRVLIDALTCVHNCFSRALVQTNAFLESLWTTSTTRPRIRSARVAFQVRFICPVATPDTLC